MSDGKQEARLVVVERLSKVWTQRKDLESLVKCLAVLEHEGYLELQVPDCSEESLWVEAATSLVKKSSSDVATKSSTGDSAKGADSKPTSNDPKPVSTTKY